MESQTNIFRPLKFGKETFHPKSYDEGAFVMNYLLDKGGMVPSHVHEHMDEHFKMIRGVMKFVVDGKTIIRKAGEEIVVPKGTQHSIKNAGNEQVEMDVAYMPCADTHRMFELIAAFDQEQPGRMMNLFKAFYVGAKLRIREFSSPRPKFILPVLAGVVTVMGKLGGWDKYVVRFK